MEEIRIEEQRGVKRLEAGFFEGQPERKQRHWSYQRYKL